MGAVVNEGVCSGSLDIRLKIAELVSQRLAVYPVFAPQDAIMKLYDLGCVDFRQLFNLFSQSG